ncbi:TMEM165/GDT1 family protein [Marivibrio halodurans]|uniref:GDT1 family protein n=1 Tax=Marivibrio halodurans TaxID=2039722 RepID=A0A8J7RZY8_9PROT|nr:TMEM165/GDT1 family protein [Marivibrio halodurans]MBP5857822.1 TMEM165/GDT1 family protein [Marivibrio halodurans]
MDAFLISTGIVAIAEVGDKTQLLALILAARFRKPVPIIIGILIATVANHALAAWVGLLVADWLGPEILRWVLGLSFLAMAAWMLIPDKVEDGDTLSASRFGPFLATLVTFFLLEIGDKTQVATIALAARFDDIVMVTIGTTLGMMIANVPAVLVGKAAATRIPLTFVHAVAALIFAALGLLALVNAGDLFGAA